MNQDKLNYFKEKLLAKKQRLIDELEEIATKDPNSPDYQTKYVDIGDDPEDNAQEVVNYERDFQIEGTLEESLEKVNQALARIESGEYGKDIHTGALIDEKRLEILPEAETAISEK